MNGSSKTFRRLGIVGAAAVVGLVPLTLTGGAAFAVAPGSASLSISPTTTGSSASDTNTFTTSTAVGTGGTITITEQGGQTLPAPNGNGQLGTGGTTTNYTVTYGSSNTPFTGTVAVSGNVITLTNTSATSIPSGSTVNVAITGATNPTSPSSVYFTDNDGAGAVNTNSVAIGALVVTTPGVTSVNPTAYHSAAEPFTIVGTNFSTASSPVASPVVCFVPSTGTAPTPSGTGSSSTTNCSGTATTGYPATSVTATPGQIQGLSPAGLPPGTYNVVVYNYNPAANSNAGGYTAASGTTSQTLVGVTSTLDFIPESGVRVVDSRNGLALPKGALTPGTPVAIPLSDFAQSATVPTNVPGSGSTLSVSGLDVNVTGVAPASGGNLQVWAQTSSTCPNGISTTPSLTKPATVNFQPPQDTNNSQVVPVASGSSTTLCVQDNGASVNVVIDVVGYTLNYTANEVRLLDSRATSHVGNLQGPLQSNTVYSAQVCGGTMTACPATGTAMAFNIADVAPSAPGNLRAFPEPATGPVSASSVPTTAVDNYIVNTDASAMIITNITPNASGVGYLDLYSAMNGTGTINAVIDELGTFPVGSSVHTVAQPYRIYDSRPGPIPAAGTVTVPAAPSGSGTNFVPAGALGVVGNLSDINPSGQGYIVTFPAGGNVPGTASEADFPLQTRNTNNIVALNPSNGSFSIYAGGSATNSTYDVSAYIQ